MKRKLAIIAFLLTMAALFALPVFAQQDPAGSASVAAGVGGVAIGMGLAAAGCGLGQSNMLRGAFDGVARNPGAVDTIRVFAFLGLALIEFLALLTFLICYLILFAA